MTLAERSPCFDAEFKSAIHNLLPAERRRRVPLVRRRASYQFCFGCYLQRWERATILTNVGPCGCFRARAFMFSSRYTSLLLFVFGSLHAIVITWTSQSAGPLIARCPAPGAGNERCFWAEAIMFSSRY